VPERLDAHKLIEEFMILANVAAAECLKRRRCRLFYRVHDEPTLEKVHALQEFLKNARHALCEKRRVAACAVQSRAGAGQGTRFRTAGE